jgi:hypothetical protein
MIWVGVISVATVDLITVRQILICSLPKAQGLQMLILHPLFAHRRDVDSSPGGIPRV